MAKIREALLFSVLAQHSSQIIAFATIVILARLMGPAEIGVYAVAASIAFLAIEMRALGVGQYLVREAEICDEKIRSATGLMIIISWGLGAIIAMAAPYIADFYSEPALTSILRIIACSFIFAPFLSVPAALLTRNMQFQPLFIVKLFSTVVRSGSSIAYVLLGFSYYGLAMGVLTGTIAELAIISYFRPKGTPWLPSFSKLKKLFRFGVLTSTANTLQQFSLSIPDLVLARVATMTDVGLFSRGLGVIVFLNKILGQAVAPVVLPHLSEVRRTGGSVGDAYLRAIMLQGAFCWPIFAVVNLSAYSMILALFGDQWEAAAPIASVVALWAILQSTHSFSSFALLAVEKEKLMLKKEVIIFVCRLVAVILAAPYGMLAIAWALVLSGVVEIIVNTWVIKRAVGVSVRRLAIAFFPNAIIAVACWGTLKLLGYFIDFQAINPWLSLSIIATSMLIVWLVALRLTKHEVWDLVVQAVQRVLISRTAK